MILIPLVGYGIPILVGVFAGLYIFRVKCSTHVIVACAAPISLWLALTLATGGRSASSFLFGPPALAVIVVVLVMVHLTLRRGGIVGENLLGKLLIAACLLAGLCTFFFFPALPE